VKAQEPGRNRKAKNRGVRPPADKAIERPPSEYKRYALAAAALGVGPDGIAGAGTATSTDERTAVVLTFAATVLAQAGRLSDADVARARDEGLDDAAMLDIVAVIAENVLGNLVNNLAATTLDPMLQRAARGLPDAGSEAGEARPPIS